MKFYYLALDNYGVEMIETELPFDRLLQLAIEKYDLHLIGIYDNEIEAFRNYLITKELGLDKINLEDI